MPRLSMHEVYIHTPDYVASHRKPINLSIRPLRNLDRWSLPVRNGDLIQAHLGPHVGQIFNDLNIDTNGPIHNHNPIHNQATDWVMRNGQEIDADWGHVHTSCPSTSAWAPAQNGAVFRRWVPNI